jgi:hypothetical protein
MVSGWSRGFLNRGIILLVSLPQLFTHCAHSPYSHDDGLHTRLLGFTSMLVCPHRHINALLPGCCGEKVWGRARVQPALHLVGGRGGGAWRGRADADEERAEEYGREGDYDPDEEYGAGYVRVTNDPGWSPVGEGDDVDGRQADTDSDDSDSDAWAVKETTPMRRRREEDQRLVGEIGGDLSVLTIDGHKLKPRKWEPKEPVQVISHVERKRREEEQEVLAAGGTLIADDFFAKPKPSWNEREKAQWQAANLDSGFVSAKELKKKEEQDLISKFGGDLAAMTSRDKSRLKTRAWEHDNLDVNTDKDFLSAKERKKKAEEALVKEFGGGLDSVVKSESSLEREKRIVREKREAKQAKKDKKKNRERETGAETETEPQNAQQVGQ